MIRIALTPFPLPFKNGKTRFTLDRFSSALSALDASCPTSTDDPDTTYAKHKLMTKIL